MRTMFRAGLAAFTIAAASLGAIQPAQARDNSGAVVAAGIVGLGVGAALASDHGGYTRVGYYDRGYYGGGFYGRPVYYGGPAYGYYGRPYRGHGYRYDRWDRRDRHWDRGGRGRGQGDWDRGYRGRGWR
ncbi:hypothetical protein [Sphingomonas sp.]|uniref:hypothetical protein n=1 Tax=Sphingomonas sp. TaxID=28214 RepID=UPI0025DD160C|nr:hypothetical protein [Sphingomonas sp.]